MVFTCLEQACEVCLVLCGIRRHRHWGSGLVRQMTDGAYCVRAAIAYRMGPLPPGEAQAYSLGRVGRDDLKFSNAMSLNYQISPGPKKGKVLGVHLWGEKMYSREK